MTRLLLDVRQISARLQSGTLRAPTDAARSFVGALARTAIRFGRDTRAAIAMQLALLLIPLVLFIGGGIDVMMMYAARDRAQQAADAAALGSARIAEQYLATNGTGSTQITQATTMATATMKSLYAANFGTFYGMTGGTPTLTLSVSNSGVTVVVTPSITVPVAFLNLAGIANIPVSVSSTATVGGLHEYFQIIFVVDVSGSMSIGGTSTDIANLQSAPYIGCAFACHDPNDYNGVTVTNYCKSNMSSYNCTSTNGSYCPYYTRCTNVNSPYADKRALAKSYGYKLKIDYVIAAINDFITDLTPSITANPDEYLVGIDTFGTTFNVALSPTSTLSTIQTAAAAIDVDAVQSASNNYGYTYTTTGLTSALAKLTNVGDGSTATSRKTYLIFVSDGVEDVPGSSLWGRVTDSNYSSACTSIKNSNVNIFSILAPYPAVTGDSQYSTLVAPMIGGVPAVMQGCASATSNYLVATDGPGIQTAVGTVFGNIFGAGALRLTN